MTDVSYMNKKKEGTFRGCLPFLFFFVLLQKDHILAKVYNYLRFCIVLLMLFLSLPLSAQKIIEYKADMGSRDPEDANVWILYRNVVAVHDGMKLYTDSASFDTKNNIFKAYRNVRIVITDTTTLFGSSAIYDGTTRIADVWGDTVILIDGQTILKTDLLSYDRNNSTASYYHWGHTVHDSALLDSRKGHYHSDTRDLYLFDDVVLHDSTAWLYTDTLLYNTITSLAQFISPTLIVSDSSTVYSEDGNYNTETHDAASFKESRLTDRQKWMTADTLYFNDKTEYGRAFGHVVIVDTLNGLICRGNEGLTDQDSRMSFVTDSALIIYIDSVGDSLFLHADTIFAFNNESQEFSEARAYRGVRLFRSDVQMVCDSLSYLAADSLLSLYHDPVVWYGDYQCMADTIHCFYDSAGVRLVKLRSSVFAIEKVDSEKFSQVKGRNADVFLERSEPLYADILGSARMVYYVIDEQKERLDPADTTSGWVTSRSLLGVNAGMGSDMRIYFKERKPHRFSTYVMPDMKMYPPDQLPEGERLLPGFRWLDAIRPVSPNDVFRNIK